MCGPTLWCTFSKINAVNQALKGFKLQTEYRRLNLFLKRANEGHVTKQSKVFGIDDVRSLMKIDCVTTISSAELKLIKAVAILGVCGSMRCAEIATLRLNNMKEETDGFLIEYFPLKYSGVRKAKKFMVPRNIDNPQVCFFHHMKCYMEALSADCKPFNPDDILLQSISEDGKLTQDPCSRRKIYDMPTCIARLLNMSDADQYTGHCFRRMVH